MLKDRIVLVDQEIAKLKRICGDLYFQTAVRCDTSLKTKADYEFNLDALSRLITEREIIKDMINNGNP